MCLNVLKNKHRVFHPMSVILLLFFTIVVQVVQMMDKFVQRVKKIVKFTKEGQRRYSCNVGLKTTTITTYMVGIETHCKQKEQKLGIKKQMVKVTSVLVFFSFKGTTVS